MTKLPRISKNTTSNLIVRHTVPKSKFLFRPYFISHYNFFKLYPILILEQKERLFISAKSQLRSRFCIRHQALQTHWAALYHDPNAIPIPPGLSSKVTRKGIFITSFSSDLSIRPSPSALHCCRNRHISIENVRC